MLQHGDVLLRDELHLGWKESGKIETDERPGDDGLSPSSPDFR